MKFLAGLAPLIVIATAFVAGGDAPAARAVAAGAPVLAGLGLFPLVFALSRRAGSLLGIAIVIATGIGFAVGAGNRPALDLETSLGWLVLTFAGLLALVSPFLVLGWRSAAAAAWLLLAGFACGGLVLLGREQAAIPSSLLMYNPLVRVFHHGLGYDWLHAANMYPRVGTSYYSYPQRSEGIILVAGVTAFAFAIAAIMAIARRRGAAEPAPR